MLTFNQAVRSKTNWVSLALLISGLAPEIWNIVVNDPNHAFIIPDAWQHRITIIGSVLALIFRTRNSASSLPPQQPPPQ
jgi:hypothetical protein